VDVINGEELRFCCPGCLNVFRILFHGPDGPPEDYRQTELYRACVASGLIPRGPDDPEPDETRANPNPSASLSQIQTFDEELARELTLRIEGMWCTACSWLLEEVLRTTEGILDVQVFFLSDLAKIKYLPHRLDLDEVLARIAGLGYRASVFDERSEGSGEKKDLLLRLGVAAILTTNVMMISFALYAGFFEDLGQEGIRCLSYPLWALATPVIFYAGFPILKRACAGIRFAALTMDTLIAVGALSAYFYSVVQILDGSIHVYFDTASMLITLVLLGKYIETQAREKVSLGILELFELARSKARIFVEGIERWVCADAVQAGDELQVLAGERVPVDGRIISGRAGLDESILTGESRPVKKDLGDEVFSGSLVLDGQLQLRATRTGTESSVSQMVGLMQEALTRKNPVELLADRITRWFVPAIICLAAATAIHGALWGSFSMDESLLRAVTVLVITCPCALGIATPLAKVAAIGVGRAMGILVRDSAALERAKDLDVILFDKTGTLTEGNFSLRQIVTMGSLDAKEALCALAAVEVHSDHFLAREILRKAVQRAEVRWSALSFNGSDGTGAEMSAAFDFAEHPSADQYEFFEGLGVKGVVREREVLIGNRAFMQSRSLSFPVQLDQRAGSAESAGSTVVFFSWDGQIQGFLVFGDSIKAGAFGAIERLHGKGIETRLVSGDSQATTCAVARELGISHPAGQTLPRDKLQLVKKLQEEGRRVGMVGDGINDAAALAQADVGFALGAGADIARKASDITLLSEDPARIVESLELSTLTSRIIRQNLFFAFFYNLLGIPLAVSGLLNPMVAVVAMFASSLTVVANTLRISKLGKSQGTARGA
jgi:heavy metal translocating P-type ATPase